MALLDDGVDLNQLVPYYGQSHDGTAKDIVMAFGVSCCDFGRGSTHWAISSRGHGTTMANMILRINPWVQLYSMKMQDGEDALGNRTIFPGSAASAMQSAIDLEANIISMSWSIMNKSRITTPVVARSKSVGTVDQIGAGMATMSMGNPTRVSREESPISALETAIGKATEKGILMFCSATDDIQNGAMDFLPYQKGQKNMFRIGAATAQGERDPHAEDKMNIDYYFPGNQVADAFNPRSERQVQYHDGSSVSTALAAGLSSLIIYLARVMCAYCKHRGDKEGLKEFENLAEKLRRRDSMKRAFDNIDSTTWQNKKFLPVWETFERRTQKIIDKEKPISLDEKMHVLGDLVRELCTKIR